MVPLHHTGLNSIPADEMGVGKTLQTSSFLAYLKRCRDISGLRLVVAKSTLQNWAGKFTNWTPGSGLQYCRTHANEGRTSGDYPRFLRLAHRLIFDYTTHLMLAITAAMTILACLSSLSERFDISVSDLFILEETLAAWFASFSLQCRTSKINSMCAIGGTTILACPLRVTFGCNAATANLVFGPLRPVLRWILENRRWKCLAQQVGYLVRGLLPFVIGPRLLFPVLPDVDGWFVVPLACIVKHFKYSQALR